jgi:hypothetical protein
VMGFVGVARETLVVGSNGWGGSDGIMVFKAARCDRFTRAMNAQQQILGRPAVILNRPSKTQNSPRNISPIPCRKVNGRQAHSPTKSC